ncbi:MAG: carbohydrate ABC transporter permease [Egibacteraceae bacterium]
MATAVERQSTGQKIGKAVLLAMIMAWCLLPFAWLVTTSLKQGDAALNNPNPFQGPFGLGNYRSVFGAGFLYNLRNSAVVAGTTTLICVAIGALAAYALVRLPLKGKVVILGAVLAVSLYPPIALVPPLYEVWRKIGLLNSYPGLCIPYTAFTLPITIFVLTTFFAAIPPDMEEAARVDGATPLQAFWRVVVPLAAPGIFAAAILVFVYSWNEFLLASVFTPRDLAAQTVTVAIANFPGAVEFQVPIGSVTAASVATTIPMILMALVFQRRIVSGLTAGGVKG